METVLQHMKYMKPYEKLDIVQIVQHQLVQDFLPSTVPFDNPFLFSSPRIFSGLMLALVGATPSHGLGTKQSELRRLPQTSPVIYGAGRANVK